MLRNVFVLCCATVCAVLSALAVISWGENSLKSDAQAAPVVAEVQAAPTSQAAASVMRGGVTAIPKSPDGHFWAEARVNEKAVRFLVDTGATVVALTPSDAQRLGVNMAGLTYDKRVMTAAGETQAARVTLNYIGIGNSRVQNVEALVIRDGLQTSLLGMSYLGKLSRIEATPSTLILHP